MKMRRLKIGIRPQLIILVCFSSLFSLLILAIVTGVYYSNNLSNTRLERLEAISQLKGTQVLQALQFTYYQVYWVGTRDVISEPLLSYRAGNISSEVFSDAKTALDKLVLSSELFASARLYNLDKSVVVESYNNLTQISEPTMDALYPILKNAALPDFIRNLDSTGYYTGPVSNSSDPDDSYFMGLTLPVYANMSIVFPQPSLAGYLTVLVSADNIQSAINQTNTTTSNGRSRISTSSDYTVVCLRPVYGNANTGVDNMLESSQADSTHQLIGYEAVLPVPQSSLLPNTFYNINSSSEAREALLHTSGGGKNLRSYFGDKVSIGYTRIQIDTRNAWIIIVRQTQGVFTAPVIKLRNIIIGVVIGIGVMMCLITFPLAVYYVRPITKLKNATEAITRSKKEKKMQLNSTGSMSLGRNSAIGSFSRQVSPPAYMMADGNYTEMGKRNSTNSVSTGVLSNYSTGMRIPAKVRNSKKFFKDELTELTDAFNIMTDELDKQYTHLEDRVKMRTKELEASKIEAEAANEAKTVFIANISHELRTPLNGILGMTSIAMDEEEPSKIQDSLKLIHRSGELLLHILTELLTYSKNTLNRSKLEKSNFQILEVVYQVKSIFDKLAIDQRVNFHILLKPNALRKLILYGDSNRIIQIVMNLVSNSLKFTPIDGSVDVSFKLLGEYDLEKSKENEYKKVYTKPLNRSSPPVDPKFVSSSSDETNSTSYDEKHAEVHNNDNELDPKTIEKPITDDDTISITTLSTTEYENKIFESQFHYNKNLPSLPSGATEEADQTNSSLKSITASLQQKRIPPTHRRSSSLDNSRRSGSLEHSRRPSKVESIDPLKNGSKHSIVSEMPGSSPNVTTTPPEEPRASAIHIASNMSQNELVKNNKAYKIRNMYKPKTWAIQIEVRDTGPGIEPVLQEKVFEPFIQGDQTLLRSYGGTGLGLSICRQLATMMKGTLTLKSVLGQGSTFTFTVPLPQTGEIMVNDLDMKDFCEDEFNPAAKVNRRVEFAMDHEENGDADDDDEEGADADHEEEEETDNSQATKPETSDKSATPTQIPKIVFDEAPDPVRDLSSSSSNSPSTRKHVFKLEMPSKSSLFEKPHLITRSSTGTASSTEKNESSNLLGHLSELKILVAEDNMVNQEVIKRMLKLEGFTNIIMACNGGEAVDQVQQSMEQNEPFDLVFMDVQMPKMDGLTATKMIRNNLLYQKPIIALTAFADESNMKECLSCGMTGFLAKPIRRTNLRKIIVEFSPIILSEFVTTPQTMSGDEKRLGFPKVSSP